MLLQDHKLYNATLKDAPSDFAERDSNTYYYKFNTRKYLKESEYKSHNGVMYINILQQGTCLYTLHMVNIK
jgi:hypothetical protein